MMDCCGVIHDYVLGICYCVPCEFANVSMNYFEKLSMLGIT